MRLISVASLLLGAACAASTPAPAHNPNPATFPAIPQSRVIVAVQPGTERTRDVLTSIQYPATREQVLTNCASSANLTRGEKLWIEHSLPSGVYSSEREVLIALGLM